MNIGRLRNRLRFFYKEHFPLFLFVILALLLALGLSTIDSYILISAIIALILFVVSLTYYFSYFKRYRLLTDNYSQHHYYYYEVFSIWGILTFNFLFILVFAYVGSVLAVLFPKLGFGNASFYSLLIFLVQTIVDGISLGFLSSYSLDFSNLKMEGWFSKSFVYGVNLIINMAFIASLASVISEVFQIKRELKKVIESDSLDEDYFNTLTPRKVKAIIKQVKNGTFKIKEHETELLCMLENSGSKEARDIVIQILQNTKDITTFKSCLAYFSENKDYRFRRVCKRVTNPQFKDLLKNI